MQADQTGKNVYNAGRADAAGHIGRQAFMGEFIDDRQAFQRLAVGSGIEGEVVSPDMTGRHRWQGARA